MELPEFPLVWTKLAPPAGRARLVPRPRLAGLLDAAADKRAALVCAPAGYGKTTLLADWARRRAAAGAAVVWYALDPDDDSPSVFGAYLIAGWIRALGDSPGRARAARLLRNASEADLPRVLGMAFSADEIPAGGCDIFLDDVHLIESPTIHSALRLLLDRLPERVRLILGARSEPPLPLARLRARGLLLEVRTGDLRFDVPESRMFLCGTMQLDLEERRAAALEERTEGWPAGLQLVALSIAGRAVPGADLFPGSGERPVADYLIEEVVRALPESTRTFLLETSVLDRLSAPLCNAVTGRGDAANLLEELTWKNLFTTPLDADGSWFRYHPLFRDALDSLLRKERPLGVSALHRAAAAWLEGEHLIREAHRHALQSGDWDFAADFIERHGFTLLMRGEMGLISDWCEPIPEAVMQARPLLCFLQSWGLVFGFRIGNRLRVEGRLRQAEEAIARMSAPRESAELREHVEVVRTYLAMAPDSTADPQAVLSGAMRRVEENPRDDPGRLNALLTMGYARMALHEPAEAAAAFEAARQTAFAAGLPSGMTESVFQLARLAILQGRFDRALELCRRTRAEVEQLLPGPNKVLPGLGGLDIAAGCALLERNDLDSAEAALARGLDLIRAERHPFFMFTALLAMYRLHAGCGRPGRAEGCLQELEEAWPDVFFVTRIMRLARGLEDDSSDGPLRHEAQAWLREDAPALFRQPPAGMGPLSGAEAFYRARLAGVRVCAALGDWSLALPALESQLASDAGHGLAERVVELSMLEAVARETMGAPGQARGAVERALDAGAEPGFVRAFDQGPSALRLLSAVADDSPRGAKARRILAALTPADAQGAGTSRDDFGLSEREREVLRLVAEGAANQAIADRLCITVGTAKSHLNHILGKLGAANRTEAVARAREAGLL